MELFTPNLRGLKIDFNTLSKDIQEEIVELAKQYPLTIDEVRKLYLMGGDYASALCQMKSAGLPDEFIRLQNRVLWEKKNEEVNERNRTGDYQP